MKVDRGSYDSNAVLYNRQTEERLFTLLFPLLPAHTENICVESDGWDIGQGENLSVIPPVFSIPSLRRGSICRHFSSSKGVRQNIERITSLDFFCNIFIIIQA